MYDMMPPQPTQPVPPPRPRRLSVPQIMLIVAALGFLAWYVVKSLFPPAEPYASITLDSIGEHYSGDCLIVRDETVWPEENVGSVDYIVGEGETVFQNASICKVYSSAYTEKEKKELQKYRDDIKEYQQELLGKEVMTDARLEKLNNDVLTQAREVREIIHGARGNMTNQEKQLNDAIDARQIYLRDKFSSNDRMSRLYSEENQQMQKIQSWTRPEPARKDGIVSFYSDGFEDILKISSFDQFSPTEVRSMLNGIKPETAAAQRGKTTVYRIVQNRPWCVLMMIRDSKWNPVEGGMYELRLESFKSTTVPAKVVSYTRMGGELLVRLRIEDISVVPVLYMRTCTGVLGDSATSLTVPEKAIYTQNNQQGVVRVEGESKWFVQVTILKKQDGMCYIMPVQSGALSEGQTIKMFN